MRSWFSERANVPSSLASWYALAIGEKGDRRARNRERRIQPRKGWLPTAMASRSFQLAPTFSRQNRIAFSGTPTVCERTSLSFSIAALTTPSSNRAAAVSCLKDDNPRISIGILECLQVFDENQFSTPGSRFSVVVSAVAGDCFQFEKQRAFFRQKFYVAAIGANEHGVGATDAIRQKGEPGWAIIGQFGATAKTGHRQLIFDGPHTRFKLIVIDGLGFHRGPWVLLITGFGLGEREDRNPASPCPNFCVPRSFMWH